MIILNTLPPLLLAMLPLRRLRSKLKCAKLFFFCRKKSTFPRLRYPPTSLFRIIIF
jgi:hypothetical protein